MPEYPEFRPSWPHPRLYAGLNSMPVNSDEMNSSGLNTELFAVRWNEFPFGRPTVMAPTTNLDPNLPNDAGQTVDAWVVKENRTLHVARERNRERASGFRGTLDE